MKHILPDAPPWGPWAVGLANSERPVRRSERGYGMSDVKIQCLSSSLPVRSSVASTSRA